MKSFLCVACMFVTLLFSAVSASAAQLADPVCAEGKVLFAGVCRIPLPGGDTTTTCSGGQVKNTKKDVCECEPGSTLFAGVCRIPLPGG